MENSNLLQDNRLPFGNTKMILSISAIVFSPVLIGFILGVISIYLVDKDNQMYKSFPGHYNESALANHKTGTILAWVGFGVSLIFTISIIVLFYKYGTVDFGQIKTLRESVK